LLPVVVPMEVVATWAATAPPAAVIFWICGIWMAHVGSIELEVVANQ
jgi:hypothetical protein